MILTPMDYVRAAIAAAMAEGLTFGDFWACAEHAETCEALDRAVELLVRMRA